MLFSYSKLLGKIKECFGSQTVFAEKISLSAKSLSAKLNGRCEWKQSEMLKACKLLSIDTKDLHLYFFADKVQ